MLEISLYIQFFLSISALEVVDSSSALNCTKPATKQNCRNSGVYPQKRKSVDGNDVTFRTYKRTPKLLMVPC